MPYIYSTLSADQAYSAYPANLDPRSIPLADKVIHVNGQANVMNHKNFVTPRGVVTELSDEEFAVLKEIPAFKRHKEEGYITVSTKKEEPEKVAHKDMTARDTSSQLEPGDFEEGKEPKVNK